jgi:DNA-binding transcriptional regulator YdaS (Cro superfamily)
MKHSNPTLALKRAIEAAGSQSDLAKKIGKTQGHVASWLRRGRAAPDCVLAIEKATGISRHDLRPDIFGRTQ